MITKFLKRILRRDPMVRHTNAINKGAPKRITKKSHRIDPHLLSKNAVKVTQTLQQAGFEELAPQSSENTSAGQRFKLDRNEPR